MPSHEQTYQEITLLETFEQILQAYQNKYLRDLTQTRMRVLKTRRYIDGLTEVFRELKTLHEYQLALDGKPENETDAQTVTQTATPGSKNGRSLAVLVTGTQLFTGEINLKIFDQFIDHVQHRPTDILILGQIGRDLYQQRRLTHVYQYLDLPEKYLQENDLKTLISYLRPYSNIDIFFGKYLNLTQQSPTASNVTGQIKVDLTDPSQIKSLTLYIFEPELDKILDFFEQQIFTSLVKQTVNESYLAQIGSRIFLLEEAAQKTRTRQEKTQFELNKLLKQAKNKQQQQQLVAVFG